MGIFGEFVEFGEFGILGYFWHFVKCGFWGFWVFWENVGFGGFNQNAKIWVFPKNRKMVNAGFKRLKGLLKCLFFNIGIFPKMCILSYILL